MTDKETRFPETRMMGGSAPAETPLNREIFSHAGKIGGVQVALAVYGATADVWYSGGDAAYAAIVEREGVTDKNAEDFHQHWLRAFCNRLAQYEADLADFPPTPPPPSETAMTDHKHESVGVFSRGPYNATRVSICACGATQKVGSGTWTVPPNPRSFDVLPPEQRAELLAFSEWLKLPKPKMTFEVYRAEHLPPPSETKLSEAIDALISACGEFEAIADDWHEEKAGIWQMEAAQKNLNVARSSLESLYRDTATERDGLKVLLDEFAAGITALRSGNERLRSLQITPDEAKHILNHNLNPGFVDPDAGVVCEVCRDADAKLRRISSKATSEEL